MPQDWQVIAAIGSTGEVRIYKYEHSPENTKNASLIAEKKSKIDQSTLNVLEGLEDDGFGLCWSPQQKGMLVGATGKTVCVWDALNSKVPTITIKEAHQDDINDAKFSSLNPNLIGTASSDSHFKLWDIRTPKQFTQC